MEKTAAAPVTPPDADPAAGPEAPPPADAARMPPESVPEVGGPAGPDPTRFGDWERKGRCIDF